MTGPEMERLREQMALGDITAERAVHRADMALIDAGWLALEDRYMEASDNARFAADALQWVATQVAPPSG